MAPYARALFVTDFFYSHKYLSASYVEVNKQCQRSPNWHRRQSGKTCPSRERSHDSCDLLHQSQECACGKCALCSLATCPVMSPEPVRGAYLKRQPDMTANKQLACISASSIQVEQCKHFC